MIITDLQLKHFRNYTSEQFDFSDHINVITGANAQGKTNLLEALFFLARGYFHRATTVADLLDVIINIIDGSNLERNLYLTTQLAELGIPMGVYHRRQFGKPHSYEGCRYPDT